MYQGQATTFLCHVRIHRKLWTQAEPSKTPLHKMSLWHSGCPLKSSLNTSMSLLLQLRFPFPPRTQDCPLHINPWLSRKHPPHTLPPPPAPPWASHARLPGLSLYTASAPGQESGRERAQPQCRPPGFCGFPPDPECYFRATLVFNWRMCVDQKEGPKHYFFFPLCQMIKFDVLKNAQPGPELCPIGWEMPENPSPARSILP